MKRLAHLGWRRSGIGLAVVALLVLVAVRLGASEPEIALVIGEPWEAMRQRSSAAIDPAIPGHYWGRLPKSDARLRFIDPQYGFVTPLARFFTVSFDDEMVGNVRMSPQIEPLLLDDTLRICWICRSNGAELAGRQSGSRIFHPSPTPPNGVPDCET